jgi:hypothetical protein
MWGFFKKIKDIGDWVIYAYGLDTKELSGEIRVHKVDWKTESIKLPNGFHEGYLSWVIPQILTVVHNENAPDERMIATG